MTLSIHSASFPSGDEPPIGSFRDPRTFVRVFVGAFLRDVASFYPGCRMESIPEPGGGRPTAADEPWRLDDGIGFQMADDDDADRTAAVWVSLFGAWHRLIPDRPMGLGAPDRRLIRAVAAVLDLNFQILFRRSRMSILQLRRGMPEDHYIAACLEPSAYAPTAWAPSRIAEAILTLRTMALSTYENRRVSTGALILGSAADRSDEDRRSASSEAIPFGVELTSLKSLQRICDGRRTVFLIDRAGKLADVVDVRRWAERNAPSAEEVDSDRPAPCARVYASHARATRTGGDVCLVLSPNQEIKVFADGMQTFVFAQGRWRALDVESKFAVWRDALANPRLARVLFQAALDLSEERQGGLLVVVADPSQAVGRLLDPRDVLDFDAEPDAGAEPDAAPAGDDAPALQIVDLWEATAAAADRPVVDALTKRSIHYLAANRSLLTLDGSVVESLASLDGALVADGEGRLLAFGAILRHDALSPPQAVAEGARTTAAIVASRFGAVLKVSEDGVVSCFLDGRRVWDL